ncbi:small-conductance mechanosensitive channel [Microbacterium endophyticum]|uniref:Small-conductance mechanosensitive channel n=1 Tax=Microbacterium endophyticum TaxID=1526412 RepID=A0A7W4V2W4_9MICO|nr:mechanosensitive ion channel domain-containing protein [Microbacterium endophyticum]MBB2975719.1 small-conductance mechanosensitive channel [Microbacterium endophyticum]NIK36202.1 small-conductance mechanosensitive channel [Microbacterium endophyticum]
MPSSYALAAINVFDVSISLTAAVTAAAILVAAAVIAFIFRAAILRYSRRQDNTHAATWYTLSRLVTYAVIVVGVLIAITVLGVPLDRFAVLAGALGVGLGFGLQTLFSNFVSGIVLLLDKSLKVGDFVELESGVTGEVRDIKIRATTVVTNDNIDILVPNSEFVSGRVVNWTHREVLRRLRVPFGVAYGTGKEVVKKAALEAAASVPFTLDLEGPRRPQVWLSEFGASSLNFELVIWLNPEATKKPIAVTAAYNWAIHSALQRHGIEIPFPQRDLNVRSVFGLSDEEARAALGFADQPESSEPTPSKGVSVDDARDNDAIDDVSGDAADMPDRSTDEGI